MAPEYIEPGKDTSFWGKFVRAGERICVSDEFVAKHHKDIVRVDELDEAIATLKVADPVQVDAGYVSIRTDGTIFVSDSSETLRLPVPSHYDSARKITKEVFAKQSPNHEVI